MQYHTALVDTCHDTVLTSNQQDSGTALECYFLGMLSIKNLEHDVIKLDEVRSCVHGKLCIVNGDCYDHILIARSVVKCKFTDFHCKEKD